MPSRSPGKPTPTPRSPARVRPLSGPGKDFTIARSSQASLVPVEHITRSILVLRGRRVILDRDLAAIYGVTTGRLNEAVKRNAKRFPEDFVFQLTAEEHATLISQIAT